MPAQKSADKKSKTVVDIGKEKEVVTMDRRRAERRDGDPEATDMGAMKTPRRKKQRRRHIDPTTCERDYNNQEIEFMRAMDDYKRAAGRMFPTCSEVLEVVRSLGYFKLSEEQMETLGLVAQETEVADDQVDAEAAELEEALES